MVGKMIERNTIPELAYLLTWKPLPEQVMNCIQEYAQNGSEHLEGITEDHKEFLCKIADALGDRICNDSKTRNVFSYVILNYMDNLSKIVPKLERQRNVKDSLKKEGSQIKKLIAPVEELSDSLIKYSNVENVKCLHFLDSDEMDKLILFSLGFLKYLKIAQNRFENDDGLWNAIIHKQNGGCTASAPAAEIIAIVYKIFLRKIPSASKNGIKTPYDRVCDAVESIYKFRITQDARVNSVSKLKNNMSGNL